MNNNFDELVNQAMLDEGKFSKFAAGALAAGALLGNPINTPAQNIENTKIVSPIVSNKIFSYIANNEGFNPYVYLDPSKKNYAIGFGFNMSRPDAPEIIASVGGNYSDLMAKKTKLTYEQGRRLLKLEFERSIRDAKKFVPNFDDLHPDAQLVIVDMAYCLGFPRLSKFVNYKKFLQQKDYQNAAKEIIDSDWFRKKEASGKRPQKAVEILNSIT